MVWDPTAVRFGEPSAGRSDWGLGRVREDSAGRLLVASGGVSGTVEV